VGPPHIYFVFTCYPHPIPDTLAAQIAAKTRLTTLPHTETDLNEVMPQPLCKGVEALFFTQLESPGDAA
jgi:hypothetical protein